MRLPRESRAATNWSLGIGADLVRLTSATCVLADQVGDSLPYAGALGENWFLRCGLVQRRGVLTGSGPCPASTALEVSARRRSTRWLLGQPVAVIVA
jgi:hypothetical protein